MNGKRSTSVGVRLAALGASAVLALAGLAVASPAAQAAEHTPIYTNQDPNTGEWGNTIYRSTDGGNTWTAVMVF